MKTAVYFCTCSGNVTEKIDPEHVRQRLGELHEGVSFFEAGLLCSEEGRESLASDIAKNRPDRVVIAACSPREHEAEFMRALAAGGMNPYLMHMVNIREQVAWVTEDPAEASAKAARLISAGVARAALHEPLEKRELDVCPDAVVLGAGPAGLKAALLLAGAGRKVTLVEKSPLIGGMPVRYEELFPALECGPCMIEPLLGDVLHGELATNIELLTLSELTEVLGFYGNFSVKIKKRPRYADTEKCIGCAECVEACPVSAGNQYNYGMDERKAVYFPFPGALPNVPVLDEALCLRFSGGDCRLCADACPVPGAIDLDDREEIVGRKAGAVIVATGSGVYDCRGLPNLGYGEIAGVYTAPEFERLLAANGPTGGEIVGRDGRAPGSVAIIHCVGSMDKGHADYCSGICCRYALKFNHMLEKKLPGAKVYHFFRELAVPGKEDFALLKHARENPEALFIRYSDIRDLEIRDGGSGPSIIHRPGSGKSETFAAGMVVLCPAVVPAAGAGALAAMLDAPLDGFGFFEELHGRLDSAKSKMNGVYLAGACQAPMDIREAMSRGAAAAGCALSELVPGRMLDVSPLHGVVDAEKCSGCRVCVAVCPYKAISFDPELGAAEINPVLCRGCGTCAAACPLEAIGANHFTTGEILAEMEGALNG